MDKVLSARVEESVADRITSLARRLRTSKKKVIEDAIEAYAAQVDKDGEHDVFQEACGLWKRDESPAETVEAIRKAFRDSMLRYQK